MKTTKYQAQKFYNIANHIDPFASCNYDKKEEIAAIMETDFETNLEYLNGYILEHYENLNDFLQDHEIIKQYNNILKDLKQLLKLFFYYHFFENEVHLLLMNYFINLSL